MSEQVPDHESYERYKLAQQRTEEILALDPTRSAGDPTLPIFQTAALDALEDERKRFEGGDRMALLGALRICANHDVVIPEWASRAYIRAYDSVLRARVGSWDKAFGRPFGGQYMSRRRSLRDAAINHQILTLCKEGVDVGQAIAKAATTHHVSPKTAEQVYYRRRRTERP